MISLQRNDRLRVVRRRALIVLAGALLSMAIAWFAPPAPVRAQEQQPMGVVPNSWNGTKWVPSQNSAGIAGTGAIVDCGGSITTGGTAQALFTAAQFKNGFVIEVGANDSNTDSLYFSDGTTTTTPGAGVAGSLSIGPSTSTAPGGSFTSPTNYPSGVAYFINGATTGDKYKCKVW